MLLEYRNANKFYASALCPVSLLSKGLRPGAFYKFFMEFHVHNFVFCEKVVLVLSLQNFLLYPFSALEMMVVDVVAFSSSQGESIQ